MTHYGFSKEYISDFETTVEAVKTQLEQEGFGVLSSIDVQDKFKTKLNYDFHPYTILGACNPKMAYKAIQAEEQIGLMLPCNVIIYEKEGKVTVSVIRPTVAMQVIDNSDLQSVAVRVEQSLCKVLESLPLPLGRG